MSLIAICSWHLIVSLPVHAEDISRHYASDSSSSTDSLVSSSTPESSP